jgi:hypothetical protein
MDTESLSQRYLTWSGTNPSGRVIGAVTPPEISKKIHEGLQPADYNRIQAPALGIFNRITPLLAGGQGI